MKFANLTENTLRFKLRGAAFEVEPGCECEIPERVAYAVALMGLPLTPSSEVEPAPKPEPAKPVQDEPLMALSAVEDEKPKRRRF